MTWVKNVSNVLFLDESESGLLLSLWIVAKGKQTGSKKFKKSLVSSSRKEATGNLCNALSAFVIFQADSVYLWMCVHGYFVPRPQPIVRHTCAVSPGEADTCPAT